MAREQMESLGAARDKGQPIAKEDQRLMGTVAPIFTQIERISDLEGELADLQTRRLKYFGRIIDSVQPAQAFLDFHAPWLLALVGLICCIASLLGYGNLAQPHAHGS